MSVAPTPEPTNLPRSLKSPLDGHLFGSCRLELHDFQHAVRREPNTRRLLRLATGLGTLAFLASAGLFSTGEIRLAIAVGVFGLLLFASHGAPDTVAQRWYRRTPAKARQVRYTLSDQGLILATEESQRLYPWRELYSFQSTNLSHLVWVSEKHFLVIPSRAFSAEDQPRVRACLEKHIGAARPPSTLTPRLLLVAALGAAAWTAWHLLSPPPSVSGDGDLEAR